MQFLSSDLLEGRGVGTRGGQLTEEYLAAQLAAAGVKPAGENGTYFQTVPMVGVKRCPSRNYRRAKAANSRQFQMAG